VTKDEKHINYLRIALSIQGICVDNKIADQIIRTYNKVLELEDKFSIKDTVQIEIAIKDKYDNKDKTKQ